MPESVGVLPRNEMRFAMRLCLSASILLCAIATCSAQELTSTKGKQAISKYQAEVKRLDTLYNKAKEEAKRKYVVELESARLSALVANDLDEAQRIIEIKKGLEDSGGGGGVPWYVGTVWEEGNKQYRWKRDGFEVWHKGKPFLAGSWMAVDERKVLTFWRAVSDKKNYISLWEFSPDKKTATQIEHRFTLKLNANRIK